MFERLWNRKAEPSKKRSSPREQAARRQIERQLQDSRISPRDRERLTWRLDRLGKGEADKKKKPELSAKERAAAAERIHEMLDPKTGDILREAIQNKLLKGAADQDNRDRNVADAGYDPTELRRIGGETIIRVNDLNTRMNEREAMLGDDIKDIIAFHPLVYSERNGTKLRHSDLTVGASVILIRHMKKMIAVGLEDDVYKRKEIIGSEEPSVTIDAVRQYVDAMNTDSEDVAVRQRTAILGLDETERKQYEFAGSVLRMDAART